MNRKNQMEITRRGAVTVTKFKSPHLTDMETIASASGRLKKHIEQHKPEKIVFDFEKVKFFSSQVLGLLLDIRKKIKALDGDVAISSINPQLYRVFKITHLDQVFTFFRNTDTAVKNTQKGAL